MDAKLTPEMIATAVEQYNNEGKTLAELAETLDVSKATMSRALNAAGVKPKRKDGLFSAKELSPELELQIVQDYQDGFRPSQLEDMHEVKIEDIKKVLEKHGLGETEVVSADVTVKSKGKNAQVKALVDKQTIKEICDEYEKGYATVYDLAKTFNLAPNTIKWYLSKNGFDNVYAKPETSQGVKAGALRVKCRVMSDEVADILMEICRDPTEAASDRIKAGELIQNRGYGRVKEYKEEDLDESTGKTAGGKILSLVDGATRDKLGVGKPQ